MLSRKQSSRSVQGSPVRSRSSIDNLGTQVNAEVAAAEAFRRAQSQASVVDVSLIRRHTRTRTSEGSHLAEARLGRRRSNRDGKRRDAKHSVTHAIHTNNSETKLLPPATAVSNRSRPVHRASSTTAQGSPKSRTKPEAENHFVDFSCVAEASKVASTESDSRPPTRPSIRETQTDEDILNIARDRCLQDFQQHKLRERKSFFFESIQRLKGRSATSHENRPFVPDSTVPPYNHAEQQLRVSPMPANEPAPEQVLLPGRKTSKARVLSASLKGRIKKIFRSTSREASGSLPPQHVPARHLHTSMNGDDLATIGARQDYERFSTLIDLPPPPTLVDPASIGGSRITSWATSSIDGTQRPATAIGSERSSSGQTLKQRASFFGRDVQNKLRKSSTNAMMDQHRSQGLFNALQGLIHSPQHTPRPDLVANELVRAHSALQSLPSQVRLSSASSRLATSIRAATPEAYTSEYQAMSPVPEVASPRADVAVLPESEPQTVAPTSQQIGSRMKRARGRWQTSLDTTTVNPYELTPVLVQTDHGGLPQHVKHGRPQALSPSIYSQPTDGDQSRGTTPEVATTTLVTITGREVKQYTISPTKTVSKVVKEQPARFSAEWRRWMSGQLRDMAGAASVDNTVIEQAVKDPMINMASTVPSSSSTDVVTIPSQNTQRSRTPSVEHSLRLQKQWGVRTSSRQSSLMNERYPMIESSCSSSNDSVQSRGHSRQSQARPHVMKRAQSVADIIRTLRSGSAQDLCGTIPVDTAGRKEAQRPDHRPSRTDLHAKFSHKLSNAAKPVGIQRKAVRSKVNLMIDETVQNISAGPYATAAHENTAPRDSMLPALSSSEWLAGPVTKQTTVRAGKHGSPGQRLATGWLEGRSGRASESSPAFV